MTTGKVYNYAAGLRVDTFNGHMRVGHDGATAAYRASLEFYPNEKISIAWLSNSSEFDGGKDGLDELRNFLLPKALPELIQSLANESHGENAEKKSLNPVTDSTNLTSMVGSYHSDEISSDLNIILKNNELFIVRKNGETFKLSQASGSSFKILDSNIYVEFLLNKPDQSMSFYFNSPKVKKIAFYKVD